jgi:type IV secretion system protein VirB4
MMKYPDGEYDNYFAKNLNAKYQKEFEDTDTNPLKVNELYLAIVYKPFGNSVLSGIKKKTFTSYDAVKMFQNDCIKELETITEKMLTALGDYDPRLLGTYSQKLPGIDREIVFSEPMEVMSFILNGRKERVPLTLSGSRHRCLQRRSSSANMVSLVFVVTTVRRKLLVCWILPTMKSIRSQAS